MFRGRSDLRALEGRRDTAAAPGTLDRREPVIALVPEDVSDGVPHDIVSIEGDERQVG